MGEKMCEHTHTHALNNFIKESCGKVEKESFPSYYYMRILYYISVCVCVCI